MTAIHNAQRRDSLSWRVLEFLRANPTEMLTYEDIAMKFGVPITSVRNRMSRMKVDGDVIEQRVVLLNPERERW